MSDVTQILSAIESGNDNAACELLPLVYDELRRLAARKLENERPGQTLQATALVHEAYIRLVDVDRAQGTLVRDTSLIGNLGLGKQAVIAICEHDPGLSAGL